MSGILDTLSYIGDSLSKPGRAARGLLSGNMNEGLAAIPFSDSMGLTDPNEAVSGSGLLDQLGYHSDGGIADTLAGIGVEIATDPLTFAGGAIGKAIGKGASAAAAARGPRYSTTGDDLAGILSKGGANIDNYGPKELSRIASEIPPGSEFLGSGGEAVALRTPSGGVIRIGGSPTGSHGRPVSDAVLQPSRAVDIPFDHSPEWANRVEHLPFADRVGDAGFWSRRNPTTMKSPMDEVRRSAAHAGLEFTDPHYGNVGLLGGKPKIIDPNAVMPVEGYMAGFAPVTQAAEPSLLMRMLLGSIGADDATRAAIESGLSGPDLSGRVSRLGAGLGAGLGVTSRY